MPRKIRDADKFLIIQRKKCTAEMYRLDRQISEASSKLKKIKKDIVQTEQYRDKLKAQINI